MRAPLILLLTILAPLAAQAQTEIDLTSTFIRSGAVIEGLSAVQVSDIVVIRGKTADRTRAEEVSRIATTLGHARVANLIIVVDHAKADAAIIEAGRRRLELEPGLEGCTFRVDSNRGVVSLTGTVQRDSQAELAIAVLSRIDGVTAIHPDLPRL